MMGGMTEAERVQRFESAYNRIDHALTDMVSHGGDRRKHSFAAKVRIAASRRRQLSRYSDFLLEIGELRNALVHGRTGEDEYIAVPSERTVLELERIEKSAFWPEKVLPRFTAKVVTLRTDQTLAEAWALVRDDGYSRYPVYETDSSNRRSFIGLLTANGFARWCAAQLKGTRLNVDAGQVRVADVLAKDHRRDNVEFVSAETLIDDVDQMFREIKPLEAVIVTRHGGRDEPPLGLICGADLAALDR